MMSYSGKGGGPDMPMTNEKATQGPVHTEGDSGHPATNLPFSNNAAVHGPTSRPAAYTDGSGKGDQEKGGAAQAVG